MEELCRDWLKMFKSGERSDVTFHLGENELPIKCHQIVLITRAPAVFSPMFSDRWNQSRDEFLIKVPDVNPVAFIEFLKYIYGAEFDLKNDASFAIDVLYVAKKYLMDSLIQECFRYLTSDLTLSKAIDVLLKVWGEHDEVVDYAGTYIVKNFARLLENDGLGRLEEPIWIYLLEREDIVLSEFQIFRTVHAWASLKHGKNKEDGNTKVTLKERLQNVVPYIRFPTMRPADFVDSVVPLNVLDKEVAFDVICYMNSDIDRARLAEKLPFPINPRRSQAKTKMQVRRVHGGPPLPKMLFEPYTEPCPEPYPGPYPDPYPWS